MTGVENCRRRKFSSLIQSMHAVGLLRCSGYYITLPFLERLTYEKYSIGTLEEYPVSAMRPRHGSTLLLPALFCSAGHFLIPGLLKLSL